MRREPPILFGWRRAVASERGPTSATTRHVLLTLAIYMNDDGTNCFPSTRRLALDTGLSERTVCTHLEIAAEGGWIEKMERMGSGRGWRSTQYVPRIPEGAEPISVPPTQEGTERNSAPTARGTEPHARGAEPHDIEVLKEVQPTASVTASRTDVPRTRGTRLPHTGLPDDWRQFCHREAPALDPERTFASFHDYWVAQPGQRGIKLDWFATWRNWVRREADRAAPRGTGSQPPTPPVRKLLA